MGLVEALHESPWGNWQVIFDEPEYKVKRIVMKPGGRLSYQKHFKREENWMVVQGEAKFTLDGVDKILKKGDFVHIPFEALHRIENISKTEDMVFIEIQLGTYFGEDDIVRVSDDYGRE